MVEIGEAAEGENFAPGRWVVWESRLWSTALLSIMKVLYSSSQGMWMLGV